MRGAKTSPAITFNVVTNSSALMSLSDRFALRSLAAVALAGTVVGATGAFARPVAHGAPLGASRSTAPFHLHLEKSEPAKDQVLPQAPTVIRLWYSMPPELAVTAVKLRRADGAAITTAAPHRGKDGATAVEVEIKQPLPAGSYVVNWKTASKDGHPVTGDFAFTVKAAE